MPTPLQRTLYTAHAEVSGGREEGKGRTHDGELEVDLRVPESLGGPGGGTNPEQLFAVGYAACFQSALGVAARRERVDVSGSTVRSQVHLGPVEGGAFGLAVVLEVEIPGADPDAARRVVEAAHAVCPYSNATRGNVDVDVRIVG
ncbi:MULTISPECIES: organic hydroperoxide resistance protein [unclassified Geodermatophilus]